MFWAMTKLALKIAWTVLIAPNRVVRTHWDVRIRSDSVPIGVSDFVEVLIQLFPDTSKTSPTALDASNLRRIALLVCLLKPGLWVAMTSFSLSIDIQYRDGMQSAITDHFRAVRVCCSKKPDVVHIIAKGVEFVRLDVEVLLLSFRGLLL